MCRLLALFPFVSPGIRGFTAVENSIFEVMAATALRVVMPGADAAFTL